MHPREVVIEATERAAREAAPGREDRFVLFHVDDGGRLWAQRLGRDAVNLDVLMGKSANAGTAIESVIDALWPEAPGSTRRMLMILASAAQKAGRLIR